MSAYIIEQSEYRKMTIALRWVLGTDFEKNAQHLFAININAVNYRYSEKNPQEEWKPITIEEYNSVKKILDKKYKGNENYLLAKLNKFINSVVYQCCEGEYNEIEACACAWDIKRAIADYLLDGDDIKDWGELEL